MKGNETVKKIGQSRTYCEGRRGLFRSELWVQEIGKRKIEVSK